jgi:hypothetical protein
MTVANTHVRLDLTKPCREPLKENPVGLHRNYPLTSVWCIVSHRVPALRTVSHEVRAITHLTWEMTYYTADLAREHGTLHYGTLIP